MGNFLADLEWNTEKRPAIIRRLVAFRIIWPSQNLGSIVINMNFPAERDTDYLTIEKQVIAHPNA